MRSQKELRQRLGRAGFAVSQPVLSRDLHALGVAKHSGKYEVMSEGRVTPLGALRPLLRDVDMAAEIVVVRCEPGGAGAVAHALDAESLDGVVGTVAGDDTLFIAVSSRSAARRVREHIHGLL